MLCGPRFLPGLWKESRCRWVGVGGNKDVSGGWESMVKKLMF